MKKYEPKRRDMLPLWTDAYMADTTHLSLEQHGAYFLLIQKAWRDAKGEAPSLPDDDMYLRNTLSITQKKWLAIKPYIMAFWVLKDKKWTQKKLTKLWQDDESFRSEQRRRKSSRSDREDPKDENGFPQGQTIDPKNGNENKGPGVTIAEAEAVADESIASTLQRGTDMEVRALCLEAAGDCIKTTSQSHIRIRDVLLWLDDVENPCDLHKDVLPAMRDIAARASPPRDITTFRYFRNAVMDYRDQRLAGNPKPDLSRKGKTNERNNRKAPSQASQILARRERRAELLRRREADRASETVRSDGAGKKGFGDNL